MVASLGAGVTLAAAASLCLLLVSAVVAFNGWPGELDGVSGSERAVLPAGAAAASSGDPTSGGTPARASAPRTDLASVPAPAGEPARRADRRASSGPAAIGASPDSSSASPSTPASAGDPSTSSPASAAKPPSAGDTVRSLTNTTGRDVGKVTQGVGQVVSPALPQAGAVVQDTGKAVDETVGQAGGIVGDAVDSLLPKRP